MIGLVVFMGIWFTSILTGGYLSTLCKKPKTKL